MAEPYKRLEEIPGPQHQQTAVDVEQINSFLATAASGKIRRLKMYNAMVVLAFAELSMAVLILLLGTTCTILRDAHGHSCQFGTAVWVGFICIMAGILGVIALKVPEGRKGFMLAYLVLCIFSCVADGVLMIFSSIWVSMNSFMRGDSLSKTISTISLNSTLLIASFTHSKCEANQKDSEIKNF